MSAPLGAFADSLYAGRTGSYHSLDSHLAVAFGCCKIWDVYFLLGRNMASPLKFNVFGTIMIAELLPSGWQLFVLGTDGKRSRADVVVPDFIQEDKLQQFLDDLFHESATRERPSVIRLSD